MVNSSGPLWLLRVRITATSPLRALAASTRCSSALMAIASGALPVGTLPAMRPSSMEYRLSESAPKFDIQSVPLSAVTMPCDGSVPIL